MAKFNIIHIFPFGVNGTNGYNEVISTLVWGLNALGHDVDYKPHIYVPELDHVNEFKQVISGDAINILLGAQIMNMPFLEVLPNNTIIYNLEQRTMFMRPSDPCPPEYVYQAERFVIWDYSVENMKFWRWCADSSHVRHVKIGYAPILSRIPRADTQDIDILIYGGVTPERVSTYYSLCKSGLSCVYVCGLFGDSRDSLIARSKVVLNISQYDKIFEIVRVSYLLANSKAVVAELDPVATMATVEPDIIPGVQFAPLQLFPQACLNLVHNEPLRLELERTGRAIIEQRDIRHILHEALSELL